VRTRSPSSSRTRPGPVDSRRKPTGGSPFGGVLALHGRVSGVPGSEALLARVAGRQASATSRIRSWLIRLLAPSPRWALAGLALVTLILFFSNLTLWARLQRLERAQATSPFQVVILQGTERLPQAEGVLLFEPSNHYAVLVAKNLPTPEAGRAYQLWLIRPDGQRVSGAVFSVPPSSPWVTVIVESPEPLEHFPAFGITLEPTGGSPRPTGPSIDF